MSSSAWPPLGPEWNPAIEAGRRPPTPAPDPHAAARAEKLQLIWSTDALIRQFFAQVQRYDREARLALARRPHGKPYDRTYYTIGNISFMVWPVTHKVSWWRSTTKLFWVFNIWDPRDSTIMLRHFECDTSGIWELARGSYRDVDRGYSLTTDLEVRMGQIVRPRQIVTTSEDWPMSTNDFSIIRTSLSVFLRFRGIPLPS